MPAASSAATARNDVVVLPSVPVMPTTPSSWLGSPYHHAAAVGERGPGRRRRRAAAARPRARRARRARPPRRPAAAAATKSWPSTCSPGTATNSDPGADGARVVGDAADRDRGQRRRPDRPAVAARPAQPALGGQPLDRGRRAGAARRGSAAASSVVDRRRRVIARPAVASARPATRPAAGSRGRRMTRSWAPVSSSHSPAERALVLVQARTAARPRAARGARPADVDAAEVHLARSPRGSRAGSPASGAGGARPGCVAPGRRRGRPSGRSTAGRRGGTGRRPGERRRPPASPAPRGGRGGRPRGPPSTRRRTTRAARTRSGAARRSRAAGRRSGRGRPRPARAGARSPPPTRLAASRASWRTTTTPSRSAPRIRCRVDFAIPLERGVLVGAAPSGSDIRWRDGWISSIGWKPARRDRVAVAGSRPGPRRRPRRRRRRSPASASATATRRAAAAARRAPAATGPRGR